MKSFRTIFIIGLTLFILTCSVFSQNLESKIKQDIFTLASDSMLGRKAGSTDLGKSANYIIQRLNEMEINTNFGYFDQCNGSYRNLYAVIEGVDPILKDEYIILGAHYDHLGYKIQENDTIVYNGADDNASGVACLLEMIRKMQKEHIRWKRSIIFVFFDAEEIGLYGSEQMAANGLKYKKGGAKLLNSVPITFEDSYMDYAASVETQIKPEQFKMMMSLDMVGWLKASQTLKITGVGMLNTYETYFENLILKGGTVAFKKFDNSIFTGSDHVPFAKNRIPALHITTGIKSPYHKPEDDAELIDIIGIQSVANYIFASTERMANADTLASSNKLAYKHRKTRKNYLGIHVGIGANNFRYKEGSMNGKGALSLGAGLFFNGRINHILSIKTGVNYYYSGGSRYEGKIKENILSVPLLLNLGTSDASDIVLNIGIGPYYDWCFSNTAKYDDVVKKNILNQHDVGLMGAITFKVSRLILGIEIKGGFLDLEPGSEYGKSTRMNTMFRMGYIF